MRSILNYTKSLLGRNSKPTEVEERKTPLGMSRIVFNRDSDFKIRKT